MRLSDHVPERGRLARIRSSRTKVSPIGFDSSSSDLNELIDKLLDVNRPLEAFHAIEWYWSQIETSRLKRILYALAAVDPYGHIDQHSLSSAFGALDERPDVTTREKAHLEFAYVTALTRSEHGIPNLEELIATTPTLFVEVIEAVYVDNPNPDDPVRRAQGTAAYFTLQDIRRTPGSDENGNIDSTELKSWLDEVRTLSAERDLTSVCDSQIGQLLSRAPADGDGYWSSRAVCEGMEWLASEQVREGFVLDVYNSRGAEFRGRGGDQERELAEQYRAYARRTAYEYPFTSSTLRRLADGYDIEARWWDTRKEVVDRLHG